MEPGSHMKRVESLCGAGWPSLLCAQAVSSSLGFCCPAYEMEIGNFPFSSLSSTKHRPGGLDKLTSCLGHKLCCQNVVSPPTLTSPGNLTLDGSLYLAAQLGGHDG